MKRLLAGLLSISLCIPALAQTWQRVATLPTPRNLNGVSFANSVRGVVVGDDGAFFQTEDAGQTWRRIAMPEFTTSLQYAFWLGDQHGWVVGSNGSQEGRRTSDGGQTWTHMSMPAGSYYAIRFLTPSFGSTVGNGGACITRNGGSTWQITPYNYVAFQDTSLGLGWDDDGVDRTADGGLTWQTTLAQPNMVPHWLTSTVAIAAGSGGIYRSTDAGISWSKVSNLTSYRSGAVLSPSNIVLWNSAGNNVFSVDGGNTWHEVTGQCPNGIMWAVKVDANTICAVSGVGDVYRSSDVGFTWSQVYQGLGGLPAPWTIQFADGMNGWVSGEGGTILHTSDGGVTWRQQMNGFGTELYSIVAANDDVILAAGGVGYVVRSTDGGTTWETIRLKVTGPIWGRDESIEAVDIHPQSGFAVAAGAGGLVFRSMDAGQTWQSVGFPAISDSIHFNDVKVVSSTTAYAVGGQTGSPGDNSIWRTTDAGLSWQNILQHPAGWITVEFTDENHGWLLNAGSGLLRTVDGGQTWSSHSVPSSYPASSMDFANSSVGYACGWYGYMYKTINGGQTWTPLVTSDGMVFLNVLALDANNVLAVGRDENFTVRLWRSSNGGTSWTQEQVEDWPYSLVGMASTPNGTLFLSGYDGTILRKTNTLTTILPPSSFTVTGGTVVGGSLPQLLTSDNQYLNVRAIGVQDTALEILATAPASDATALTFVVEAALNPQIPAFQRIEFFDYAANAFVTVDLRSATTADSVARPTVTNNPSRFIHPSTRQVRAKVTWSLISRPMSDRANARNITIDHVQWEITR